MFKKMLGSKNAEVSGKFRKLHNEKLGRQYRSYSVISTGTSLRLKWAMALLRVVETKMRTEYLWKNLLENYTFKTYKKRAV